MNIDNQVTIIEITADYLCLVVLGEKNTIDELILSIKKHNPTDIAQYLAVKIDNPSANKCNEIMQGLEKNLNLNNNLQMNVFVDDGVESAQCYTYAEGYSNKMYMLMTLIEQNNDYVLGYPKFELGDEEDPEELVEEWFKKKIKRVPKGVRRNTKLVTVVGSNTNILVLATKINNKKKKE